MIVRNVGPEAVKLMTRVDLATVTEEPPSPIGYFDFHDCTCGVGSFVGSPPWELHTSGDELLHILSGASELTVRGEAGETTRLLESGDLVVVPKGSWHRNNASDGVTMLFMTPREGNQHSWEDPDS